VSNRLRLSKTDGSANAIFGIPLSAAGSIMDESGSAPSRRYPPIGLVVVILLVVSVASAIVYSGPQPRSDPSRLTSGPGRASDLGDEIPAGSRSPVNPRVQSGPATALAPYVLETLVEANDSLRSGFFQGQEAGYPSALAFDSRTGEIFVTNEYSNSVSVISARTGEELSITGVGSYPDGVAVDNSSGDVFVANYGGRWVSVISDSTDQVTRMIAVGVGPAGIAYDSGKAEMFVVNTGSNNVSVINAKSYAVVANIPVLGWPTELTYDPAKGEVFVNDLASSGEVSVISDATNRVVATIPVGNMPDGLAFDNETDEVYVGNEVSGNVSVISDATNRVVATIPGVADPGGVTVDPAVGEVYVTGQVSDNVTEISDSLNQVTRVLNVGLMPDAAVADASSNNVYIADSYGDNLTVVSGNSSAVVGSVTLGYAPDDIAVDTGTGTLFVSDGLARNVSEISGASNRLVGAVPGGIAGYFSGLAYDTSKREMFVIQGLTAEVGIIPDSTGNLTREVRAGSGPDALSYDQEDNEILVTNRYSDNLSVISDQTNMSAASVGVGEQPQGIAFDPGLNEAFVSDSAVDDVSVVNLTSRSLTTTIRVGYNPIGILFDPGTNDIYVANADSNNVSVISTASNTVVRSVEVGSAPYALTLDPSTHELFVTDSGGTNVTVIDDGNNTVIESVQVGSAPNGVAYDPLNGLVYVAASTSGSISILSTSPPVRYSLEFNETGLPRALNWTVQADGVEVTTNNSSLSFEERNGTVAFQVDPPAGYVASPTSGNLLVDGGPVWVTIVFTAIPYDLTFTETGLHLGTDWSVTLDGGSESSTSSAISFSVPNGTYAFVVQPISGYVANKSSGEVEISGVAAQVPISFTSLRWTVTFGESGLASGVEWGVELGGAVVTTNLSTIQFDLPNGSYSYSIEGPAGWEEAVVPYSGSVIIQGAPISLPILEFYRVSYNVTITQSGLPANAVWWVNLSTGQSVSGSLGNQVFTEANGSYSYVVACEPTSYASGSGFFVVAGQPLTLRLSFRLVTFQVTFVAHGLPAATPWSLTVRGGNTVSSDSSDIEVITANGTYQYEASAVGYSTISRSFVVSGDPSGPIDVNFTETHPGTPFGLGPGANFYVLIGSTLATVIIAVCLALILLRRRAPPPAGGP
jgi:YVTN family beta-propeller protein